MNAIEILIFKALIYQNISHDELVLVSTVPKEYDDTKKEIKNYNNKTCSI